MANSNKTYSHMPAYSAVGSLLAGAPGAGLAAAAASPDGSRLRNGVVAGGSSIGGTLAGSLVGALLGYGGGRLMGDEETGGTGAALGAILGGAAGGPIGSYYGAKSQLPEKMSSYNGVPQYKQAGDLTDYSGVGAILGAPGAAIGAAIGSPEGERLHNALLVGGASGLGTVGGAGLGVLLGRSRLGSQVGATLGSTLGAYLAAQRIEKNSSYNGVPQYKQASNLSTYSTVGGFLAGAPGAAIGAAASSPDGERLHNALLVGGGTGLGTLSGAGLGYLLGGRAGSMAGQALGSGLGAYISSKGVEKMSSYNGVTNDGDAHDIGVADALNQYGLTKEAAEVYLSVAVCNNPRTKVAMEGGANPFDGMGDAEILKLISQLPPNIQQEIMAQLQSAAGAQPSPAVAGPAMTPPGV